MKREELKERWEKLVDRISKEFAGGDTVDLDAILFLIGVQELGHGYRKFKKDEKINLMHIAICSLLEPYGYYKYEGIDKDGWPHFQPLERLPNLKAGEQSLLMKEAVVKYFMQKEND